LIIFLIAFLFIDGSVVGCLRLLDGKFRSAEVLKVLEAHSGSIRDVCMQADGRTLITCGTSKRPINPYDPKSPCHVSSIFFSTERFIIFSLYLDVVRCSQQYSNDTQIKVFDLRMNRVSMMSPLQVSSPSASGHGGVGVVRLIAEVDSADPVQYTSVMLCTDDGVMQVCHHASLPGCNSFILCGTIR
jgi:WD40 repeat protein